MLDTSLAIQAAFVAALKLDTDLIAIVGEKVYDRVPEKASMPYVVYGGDDQVLSDDADCVKGYEAFVSIHAWSVGVGQPEMKRMAGAIREALHNAELTIIDHDLLVLEHSSTRYLRDPDGITSHGVVQFRLLLDATN